MSQPKIDWTKSMEQTFEYYTVDPNTWKDDKQIANVESSSFTRDKTVETLGSATIDCASELGECYIRAYLVAIQNGVTFKFPLATVLVQTPNDDFDGKRKDTSLDAYTPLLELKESPPPVGYSLMKDQPIMDIAYALCREKMRAPVVPTKDDKKLYDDFVSNLDDSWLTFIRDLIANAKFEFDLDPMGKIMFKPIQDVASLQPVHTFDDGNSSILYPTVKHKRDLYGIPNVVEVVYSTDSGCLFSRIVNDDPNSPISTVNRGREIVYRDSRPNVAGDPNQEYLDAYAEQLLRNLSTLEHTITFKHGYVDNVRVGDCVYLDYKRAGFEFTKAQIISQNIKCTTGCPVDSTAVYTEKLWR